MIPHSKPFLSDADRTVLLSVMRSGMLAEGDKTKEFEENVRNYLEIPFGLATSSGSSALSLSLLCLGLGKGDEVVIPTYVCNTVYKAVVNTGAKPILCDIGPDWNMTFESVGERISRKTKAIILVHIFGINAWDNRFRDFNIPVIEDFCQAFSKSNSSGDWKLNGISGVYSFHATKCLCTGEGGFIVTRNASIFKKIRNLKDNHNPFSRMTDLQATLGISQLHQYPSMLARRNKLAKIYLKELNPELISDITRLQGKSMFFRFPIKLKMPKAQEAITKFSKMGIAIRKGVDSLIHKELKRKDKDFPNATYQFHRTLSLPIYPSLTGKEQKKIIHAVNSNLVL